MLVESIRTRREEYRVNGTVSNMPEFREAYHCKADAPMVNRTPAESGRWNSAESKRTVDTATAYISPAATCAETERTPSLLRRKHG